MYLWSHFVHSVEDHLREEDVEHHEVVGPGLGYSALGRRSGEVSIVNNSNHEQVGCILAG